MGSETSIYPRVTIWNLGIASFGCFRQKSEQSQKNVVLGGGKKKNSHLAWGDPRKPTGGCILVRSSGSERHF